MRRWNAGIGALLMVLLLIHLVTGAFELMGLISGGQTWRSVLSWIMVGLLALHMIFGILLTRDSLKTVKQKKNRYLKQNLSFWISRVSGFAMIVLAVCHVVLFTAAGGEAFRLKPFGTAQLILSVLLVLALICHIVPNIRSMFISLGAEPMRKFVRDAMLVMLALLVFGAIAFLVYYLRWNVWWR